MLKSLLNKLSFQKSPGMALDQRPDFNRLIVMNADRLIEYTGQQGRIRHLKRIVMLDDTSWQYLYQDVIERYAELVQLMPASQAHHHTVPGGLFIHTLEVLEYALSIRKQYKLPTFASEKEQEDQRHMWTYAIFAAVILHDVGKRLTMCRFISKDNGIIEPFQQNKNTLPTGSLYRIEFLSTKYYTLHQQLGLMFAASLFPPAALNMLGKHLHALEQLLGYLHDDREKSGAVGEIVSKADQLSTKDSLEHSSVRKFDGATLENIGERLMTCLRRLLASNHFAVNRSNGNVYTTADGYTYILSKTLADSLRESLKDEGQTDIPSDNNRIFDILGEYNFAERDENGRVMHYIKRSIQGNTHTFSVLKFRSNRLFRVLPEAFSGTIDEVAGHDAKQHSDKTKSEPSERVSKDKKPPVNNPVQDFDDADFPYEENYAARTVPEKTDSEVGNPSIAVDSSSEAVIEVRPKSGPVDETTELTDTEVILDEFPLQTEKSDTEAVPVAETNLPQGIQSKSSPAAENTHKHNTDIHTHTTEHNDQVELGESFLNWCRENIKKRKIVINESSGLVNKIGYKGNSVVSVVSPRGFFDFAETIGLPREKAIATRIQNSVHQLKLNIPGPRGQLHHYQIKKSENNPLGGHQTLYLYLFDIDKFCANDSEVRTIIDSVENNTNLMPSINSRKSKA